MKNRLIAHNPIGYEAGVAVFNVRLPCSDTILHFL